MEVLGIALFNNSSPSLHGGVDVLSEVFPLIGVTRSPYLSEVNVVRVRVKYHQLFGAKANTHSLLSLCASQAATTHFSFIQKHHRPWNVHASLSCFSFLNSPSLIFTGVAFTPVIQG